jgi:hypothetical protein
MSQQFFDAARKQRLKRFLIEEDRKLQAGRASIQD